MLAGMGENLAEQPTIFTKMCIRVLNLCNILHQDYGNLIACFMNTEASLIVGVVILNFSKFDTYSFLLIIFSLLKIMTIQIFFYLSFGVFDW